MPSLLLYKVVVLWTSLKNFLCPNPGSPCSPFREIKVGSSLTGELWWVGICSSKQASDAWEGHSTLEFILSQTELVPRVAILFQVEGACATAALSVQDCREVIHDTRQPLCDSLNHSQHFHRDDSGGRTLLALGGARPICPQTLLSMSFSTCPCPYSC